MAAINKTLFEGVLLTDVAVPLYESPINGAGTKIIALSIANNGGTTETYSLHLVPSGGSADSTNIFVPERSLANKETDIPAEVINQSLKPGGTIQALASTTLKINIGSASGVEYT